MNNDRIRRIAEDIAEDLGTMGKFCRKYTEEEAVEVLCEVARHNTDELDKLAVSPEFDRLEIAARKAADALRAILKTLPDKDKSKPAFPCDKDT